MNLRPWLRPGIGVKRWVLLSFLGLVLLALAGALALRQVYRDIEVGGPLQSVVSLLTLQFLPYGVRGAVLLVLGGSVFLFGAWRLLKVLVGPFLADERAQPLVEVIYQKRFLSRGPRIVAIGGGTGLSTLLRGLKEHSANITAIVSVADDGGSSGRLREQIGLPAVGDIRNCLVALADAEPLMGDLLQYRFHASDGTLAGHPIGNLLLAAMYEIDGGDFEESVRRMNRVLAVRGHVVPVSPTPAVLHARLYDGSEVDGQSVIAKTRWIQRVWLSPDDIAPSADALRAIAEADVIVIGPGSLFTSILPGLLIPEIRDAILASSALRIYVCNVATQQGETAGFDLADHVEALERHTAPGIADVVLANGESILPARAAPGDVEAVRLRWPPAARQEPRLVIEDVVDPANPHHHDPVRLAAAVMKVYEGAGAGRRRSPVARTA
jgi:uncharacterized cofD-like protein